MRVLFAAIAALLFSVSSAAAQSWSFDPETVTASVARSGASLHVSCARRGALGVLYQFDSGKLAREVRGKRDTVFAFADQSGRGARHTTIEVPLRTGQGKAYLAFYGEIANGIISRMAAAPRVVVAGIGLPAEDGFSLFNLTEFSASGSSAAIAAVAKACRR